MGLLFSQLSRSKYFFLITGERKETFIFALPRDSYIFLKLLPNLFESHVLNIIIN